MMPEGDWLNEVRLVGYLTDRTPNLRIPIHKRGRNFSFVSSVASASGLAVDFEGGPYIFLGQMADFVGIHCDCWRLLKRAIRVVGDHLRLLGTVQTDVVVGCLLAAADNESQGRWTNLDVGDASKFRGMSWSGNQTSQAWLLTRFWECPGVEEYILNPPPIATNQPPHTTSPLTEVDNPESTLNRLPLEVLVQILCNLPRKDALNFRLASRAVAAIFLPQEFWKRMTLDVPYMWEVQKSVNSKDKTVNWRRLYEELINKDPMTPELRGLRNRKRVWRTAMKVAKTMWIVECHERQAEGRYTALFAKRLGSRYLWNRSRDGEFERFSSLEEAAESRGFCYR